MSQVKYKRTASADDSGFVYEIKMTAFMILRLHSCSEDFFVASNLMKAGIFDDIVFSAKINEQWMTYFIQLKHKIKKNNNISLMEIYQGTSKSKDFSIPRYFESFQSIGQQFKPCNDPIFGKPFKDARFVLFTNAYFHDEFLRLNHDKCDIGFLSTHTETENNIQLSGQIDYPYLRGILTYETINSFADFADKFYFCSGQASESDIDLLVEKELENLKISQSSVQNMKHQLYEQVRLMHRGGKYITSKIFNNFLSGSWLDSHDGQERVAFVKFTDSYLKVVMNSLEPGHPIYLTSETETVMCKAALKQLGLLDKPNIELNLKSLDEAAQHLLSVWSESTERALIIDCDVDVLGVRQENVIQLIKKLFQIQPKNRIIFVANKSNTAVSTLMTELAVKNRKFNCTLKNLDAASKESLEEYELDFQGYNTPFCKLSLGSKTMDDVFTMDLMTNILQGKKVSVGTKPLEPIPYYVSRILKRPVVDASIFTDENLARNIWVVSGPKIEKELATLPFEKAIQSSNLEGNLNLAELLKLKLAIILDDPEHFNKLCCSSIPVHWLEKIGNKLYWRRSHGRIKPVSTNLNFATSEYISTEKKMDAIGRVVVISAEPGMGKSTLLSHLAAETKRFSPYTWVVTVKLNDFIEYLIKDDFRTNSDVRTYELLRAAAEIDSSTTKFNARLFKHCYEVTGNMIVFLDGFDEITPYYTESGRSLLYSLIKSKISRIWVSTRPNCRALLQHVTNSLAFSLQPLGEKEQTSLLRKYWKEKGVNEPEEKLNEIIKNLLTLVKDSLDDACDQFTGIALQTLMVAEAFDPKAALPKHIDRLQLFEHFVGRKLGILNEEKSKLVHKSGSAIAELRKLEQIRLHDLMQLALITLLTPEECLMLKPSIDADRIEELKRMVTNGEEKTGFVVSFKSQTPNFIHRTFAEYFVATFLAKYKTNNNSFLLSDTFFSESFSLVRSFFDRILAQGKTTHCHVLNRDLTCELDVLDKDSGGRTALHLAAGSSKGGAAVSILLKAGADPEIKDSLLNYKPIDYALRLRLFENIAPLMEASTESFSKPGLVPVNWKSLRFALSGDYLKLFMYLLNQNIADEVELNVLSPHEWLEDSNLSTKLTLLHVAAWYNAKKIIGYLLNPRGRDCKLPQINDVDEYGYTPILLAIMKNNIDSFVMLANAGANVWVNTPDDRNVARIAVEHQNDDTLKALVEVAKLHVNGFETFFSGALSLLIGSKTEWCIGAFYTLLSNFPSIAQTKIKGAPLIIAACLKGNAGFVELLRDKVDVNEKCRGVNALHFAVKGNDEAIVETLLRSPQIRIDDADYEGNRPLDLALKNNNSSMVMMLEKFILSSSLANKSTWHILHENMDKTGPSIDGLLKTESNELDEPFINDNQTIESESGQEDSASTVPSDNKPAKEENRKKNMKKSVKEQNNPSAMNDDSSSAVAHFNFMCNNATNDDLEKLKKAFEMTKKSKKNKQTELAKRAEKKRPPQNPKRKLPRTQPLPSLMAIPASTGPFVKDVKIKSPNTKKKNKKIVEIIQSSNVEQVSYSKLNESKKKQNTGNEISNIHEKQEFSKMKAFPKVKNFDGDYKPVSDDQQTNTWSILMNHQFTPKKNTGIEGGKIHEFTGNKGDFNKWTPRGNNFAGQIKHIGSEAGNTHKFTGNKGDFHKGTLSGNNFDGKIIHIGSEAGNTHKFTGNKGDFNKWTPRGNNFADQIKHIGSEAGNTHKFTGNKGDFHKGTLSGNNFDGKIIHIGSEAGNTHRFTGNKGGFHKGTPSGNNFADQIKHIGSEAGNTHKFTGNKGGFHKGTPSGNNFADQIKHIGSEAGNTHKFTGNKGGFHKGTPSGNNFADQIKHIGSEAGNTHRFTGNKGDLNKGKKKEDGKPNYSSIQLNNQFSQNKDINSGAIPKKQIRDGMPDVGKKKKNIRNEAGNSQKNN